MTNLFLYICIDLDICRISNRAFHKHTYSLQGVDWLEDATSTSTTLPGETRNNQTHPQRVIIGSYKSSQVETCFNVYFLISYIYIIIQIIIDVFSDESGQQALGPLFFL